EATNACDDPSVTLTVANGTLTNRGSLTSRVGDGFGASRNIDAHLDNSGAININLNTDFSKLNGTFTNTGTITITPGQTLRMASTGQTFNQDGGALTTGTTLTPNGGGTSAPPDSGLQMPKGGAFNFNGG